MSQQNDPLDLYNRLNQLYDDTVEITKKLRSEVIDKHPVKSDMELACKELDKAKDRMYKALVKFYKLLPVQPVESKKE